MPELPEVETVRKRLSDALLGAKIKQAHLRRRDVLRDPLGSRKGGSQPEQWLLSGRVLKAIERRGKQLYLEDSRGQGLLIRLGMSGWVALTGEKEERKAHCHASWVLQTRSKEHLEMHFIDPRRFGGLFAVQNRQDLESRFWSRLGPDALSVEPDDLYQALGKTRRSLKAALLDQHVLAGVGYIYADEALYAARMSPYRSANTLNSQETSCLAKAIRNCLNAACERGGTTLKDYRAPDGEKGGFASELKVYGRYGESCLRCGEQLSEGRITARRTVWCRCCQSNPKVTPKADTSHSCS